MSKVQTGTCRVGGIAATLAMTMLAGIACGQSVVMTFEGNTVGALAGQAAPGGVWAYPTSGDRAGVWSVVNGGSPAGGGTKAIQYTGGGNIRLAGDFGQDFQTGFVKFQFDINGPSGAATRLRLMLDNKSIPADSTTGQGDVATFMVQHYFDAGGGQFSTGIWGSNAPTFGSAAFNDNIITRASGAQICANTWYRMAYYYDFDQSPPKLVLTQVYNINSGTPVLVAERAGSDAPGLGLNNQGGATNTKKFRTLVLRMTDSAAGAYKLDNIRLDSVGSVPSVSIGLTDPGDPAPVAGNANPAAADATVTEAVDLGFAVGLMPSITKAGNNYYTMDDANGLLRWDGASTVDFVDAALPIVFGSNQQATMTSSADGSKLYVVSVTSGLGSTTTAAWRDLSAYNLNTNSWGLVVDSGAWNPTGDGHIGRVVVNGKEIVYTAWQGAASYTAFNATTGQSAVAISGVGNRWTGAATEGRTADEALVLAQTDGLGGRLNNSPMPVGGLNALYRTTYAPGCVNDVPILRRVSASGKSVPWSANDPSADGPGTNRQSMTLACSGDQVWLIRGANNGVLSNQIGVYSIANDVWQVLNVFDTDGVTPLDMARTDITAAPDGVYFIMEGRSKVYHLPCVTFSGGNNCPADFNADGFVDDTDFVIFAQSYDLFTVPPANPATDLNSDGFVDDTDFVIFAQAYDAFVCP